MPRYVALFRGINVGRAKRIAMADLRKLLESMGYTEVRTLLNSGNAVFEARAAKSHAEKIRKAVAEQLGVDALVIVKSAKEIAAAVADNALQSALKEPSRLLVALAADQASLEALKPMAHTDWGNEEFQLGRNAAYVWCADGILESQIAVSLMKTLAKTGTTRNWATLLKIDAMLRGAE